VQSSGAGGRDATSFYGNGSSNNNNNNNDDNDDDNNYVGSVAAASHDPGDQDVPGNYIQLTTEPRFLVDFLDNKFSK